MAKNGIPPCAPVPTYNPNEKPWTPSPESRMIQHEITERESK